MERKNMDKQMNLAHYFRYLWEKPNLIVIVGNSEEIIKGHNAYNAHYKIRSTEKNNEKLSVGNLFCGGFSTDRIWGYFYFSIVQKKI